MSDPTKPTAPENPKDLVAATKAPLSLIPVSALALEAVSLANGAAKYGKVNWRAAPVSASVYLDAALRHLFAFIDGEECDPVDGCHNLGAVRACTAILIDAKLSGTLIDDRPKSAPARTALTAVEPMIAAIRKLHADKSPRHFLIDGTPTETAKTPPTPWRESRVGDLLGSGNFFRPSLLELARGADESTEPWLRPFRKHDRVRVVRKVEKGDGWVLSWNPEMSRFVGREWVVRNVHPARGVLLYSRVLGRFYFPPSSLELMRAAS